jgi:hypothetical protein
LVTSPLFLSAMPSFHLGSRRSYRIPCSYPVYMTVTSFYAQAQYELLRQARHVERCEPIKLRTGTVWCVHSEKDSLTNHKSHQGSLFRKTRQNQNLSRYNQHIMTEFTYIHNKLSKDYTPTDEDIFCGRGKASGKHPGNKKFSAAIRANLKVYGEAPKRVNKSSVVVSIIKSLRENGGRFIKQDKRTKQYYELSDEQAHGKTGHAIRDLQKYNKRPSSSISRRQTSR